MSRAAVWDSIVNGSLSGINESVVWQNYSLDTRPTNDNAFMILNWGEKPRLTQELTGPELLTIWFHLPAHLALDYTDLIGLIDEVDDLFITLRDVPGGDQYTLSHIDLGDRSGDLFDDGFNTITKNATYKVHSRRTI